MKIFIVGKGGEHLDPCVESEMDDLTLFTCINGQSKYELVLSITTDGYRLIHKTNKYKIPLGSRSVILDDRDGDAKFIYSEDVTPKVPAARTSAYGTYMLGVSRTGEFSGDAVLGSMTWGKVGFGLRMSADSSNNKRLEGALAATFDTGVILDRIKFVADLSLLGVTSYSSGSPSQKNAQFSLLGRDYLSYKVSLFYVLNEFLSVGVGYGHFSYSDDLIPSSNRFFVGFNLFQNKSPTSQLQPNQ